MTQPFVPILVAPEEAIVKDPAFPPDFYHILQGPAPLAGCAFPFGFRDWIHLDNLGFRNVFCLSSENPRYSPLPLEMSVSCELDDLSCRKRPTKPKQETEQILFIAGLLVAALRKGEGCLVHCAAGRGRTGSVVGVALRMLGMPAEVIIYHLNALHQIRSGKPWPESPWQSALLLRNFISDSPL